MANKKVNQLTSKPAVNLTDLFLIADPTSGQAFKTTISDLGTAIGSGVSSVNTLVGAVVLDTDDIQELVSPTNKWFTDTRARAALSASSPLTYNSGTGAFGIQVATGSQNGYLSSTDWTTFNAKQAALSGTGFVKISGTTISYDNSTYLTTSAAASTYLALGGGTLTGPLNGTSATFTGDLTLSGTNPRLYFTDTDNNPDYFISNTDGTFTVYDVTNSTSRFTIGTTGNATFANAITGGGSITGQSLYSNGIISAGTTISAQGAFFDNGSSASIVQFNQSGNLKARLYFNPSPNTLTLGTYNTGGNLRFEVDNNVGALTIASTGVATFNYSLIGTSATFSSSVTAGGNIGVSNGELYPRIRVTSTNVGSSAAGFEIADNSGTQWAIAYDKNGGGLQFFKEGSGNRMYISNDGRFGIGASASSWETGIIRSIEIGTSGNFYGGFNGGSALYMGTAAYYNNGWKYAVTGSAANLLDMGSGNFIFQRAVSGTAGNALTFSETMRLTSDGHALFGTTGTSWQTVAGAYLFYQSAVNITRNGAEAMTLNRLASDGEILRFFRSGTQVGNVSVSTVLTTYNTTSDYRLKEDLKPINGLEIVNKIKVYDYKWKSLDERMNGVLAHELQEVLPYAVHGIKDGEQMQGVDYSKIVPVMVQAIKDLKVELDTLKNK